MVEMGDLLYRSTATSDSVVNRAGPANGVGIFATTSLPSDFFMMRTLEKPPSTLSMETTDDGDRPSLVHRTTTSQAGSHQTLHNGVSGKTSHQRENDRRCIGKALAV